MKTPGFFFRNLFAFVIILGLIHPPIAHGLGGAHEVELSLKQLGLHILSIGLFHLTFALLISNYVKKQNLKVKGNLFLMLFIIPHVLFWVGYYTLYIPFDILFMSLGIAGIVAISLKDNFQKKWLWISVNIAMIFVAFLLASLTTYPAEEWALNNNATDVQVAVLIWMIVGLCLSVTYGLGVQIALDKLNIKKQA